VKIKEHCTNIKIVGFNNYYSSAGRIATPMNIRCNVDEKPVQFKTSGHMFVYEIVNSIIKRAGK
jgi:hypothetical protein